MAKRMEGEDAPVKAHPQDGQAAMLAVALASAESSTRPPNLDELVGLHVRDEHGIVAVAAVDVASGELVLGVSAQERWVRVKLQKVLASWVAAWDPQEAVHLACAEPRS